MDDDILCSHIAGMCTRTMFYRDLVRYEKRMNYTHTPGIDVFLGEFEYHEHLYQSFSLDLI